MGRVHIISLNPDLSDALGHPLAYDSQLCLACTQLGVEFVSAANAGIDPDLLQSHPYLLPVFNARSAAIGRITRYAARRTGQVERFRREGEQLVADYLRHCRAGDRVVLYLYVGSLAHAEALYDIIQAYPQVSAHVNLFWCSWMRICGEDFSEGWARMLRNVLLDGRLILTVPTEEMQREILEAIGLILPVAPMPSTTFQDREARSILEESRLDALRAPGKADFSIVFPSLMRKPKGYDISVSTIRMLSKKQKERRYHCTLRHVRTKSTPAELVRAAQTVERCADTVRGVLPREEFQRLLKGADVIVLPYEPSEFSNRTSGLLIDALLCGVPVVVQEGTWLGNVVARYGCGIIVDEASPKAYVKAIEAVAVDYNRYRQKAISAGEKWLEDNNWAGLVDFILNPPAPLDVARYASGAKAQDHAANGLNSVDSAEAKRRRSSEHGAPRRSLVGYLKTHYPTIISIGRFGQWSLARLKKSFLGIGGPSLLVVAGLYVAAALVEPLRWYLVGVATALLLVGVALLGLSYARFIVNRLVADQRRSVRAVTQSVDRDRGAMTVGIRARTKDMGQSVRRLGDRTGHPDKEHLPLEALLEKGLDELEKRVQWRTIKSLYKGDRAFIIGNGPSLNRTPLHLLENEYTLCFNRFDLMFERLAWRPTMYMCVDDRVAENTASRINEIIRLVKFTFFPDIHPYGLDFRQFIEDAHNIFWLSLKSVRSPGSYETLPTCTTIGTVADLGLQVLAFMGFSPIYLVGVDLDYRRHETVIKHDRGNWTATQDDDPSHFDPRYFGAGAKYHEPSSYDVLISGFRSTKGILDRKGIEVLNATIGGSLEVFPRVDFRSLYDIGEDAELEMLLGPVPCDLQPAAREALRTGSTIEALDDWDEESPLQVTTLQLAEQLIPKVIFTHIPYGPLGKRYLFVRRESTCSAGATRHAKQL